MHELSKLPYAYDALDPFIDARTMEIHHDKHHAAYVNKLNDALKNHPDLEKMPLEKLLASLDAVPADIRTAVRNNGGGHFSHSLFWQVMKPKGGGGPKGKLADAISGSFGSFQDFKTEFTKQAANLFGSGWVWLYADKEGKLKVGPTPGHDNPAMVGQKALMVIDIWEHAYYLKYQNRRPEYIEAWWNIVNWDFVEAEFEKI